MVVIYIYIYERADLLRTDKAPDDSKRAMGSEPLPNPCRGVSLLSMCSDSCQGPCFDPGWISWEVWRTYVAWSMDRRRLWCTIVHLCALLGMHYVEGLP